MNCVVVETAKIRDGKEVATLKVTADLRLILVLAATCAFGY